MSLARKAAIAGEVMAWGISPPLAAVRFTYQRLSPLESKAQRRLATGIAFSIGIAMTSVFSINAHLSDVFCHSNELESRFYHKVVLREPLDTWEPPGHVLDPNNHFSSGNKAVNAAKRLLTNYGLYYALKHDIQHVL